MSARSLESFQKLTPVEAVAASGGAGLSFFAAVTYVVTEQPPQPQGSFSLSSGENHEIHTLHVGIKSLEESRKDLHLAPSKERPSIKKFLNLEIRSRQQLIKGIEGFEGAKSSQAVASPVHHGLTGGEEAGILFGAPLLGAIVFAGISSAVRLRRHNSKRRAAVEAIASEEVESGLNLLEWWANRRSI